MRNTIVTRYNAKWQHIVPLQQTHDMTDADELWLHWDFEHTVYICKDRTKVVIGAKMFRLDRKYMPDRARQGQQL